MLQCQIFVMLSLFVARSWNEKAGNLNLNASFYIANTWEEELIDFYYHIHVKDDKPVECFINTSLSYTLFIIL